VLFVAKAEGPGQTPRLVPLVGVVALIHATASGEVWLASLPETRALQVMRRQGLAPVTSRTITLRPRLLAELRWVRRDGYAITDGDLAVEGAPSPPRSGTGTGSWALSPSPARRSGSHSRGCNGSPRRSSGRASWRRCGRTR